MREVIRTTLSQAVELYTQREPRGEFVLIVQGAKEEQKLDFAQALALVQALVERGEPLSKAAKDVARQTGFKKGELYSGFWRCLLRSNIKKSPERAAFLLEKIVEQKPPL